MKLLFIGDIFGEPGLLAIEKNLRKIVNRHKVDFVVVQGENITGRKGLNKKDYKRLKTCGVNVITMGNHLWANDEIYDFIDEGDVIRPLNVHKLYPGLGSNVFTIKGQTIRVTSLLGREFNDLRTGWRQNRADNFFDAIDKVVEKDKSDFHIIDFHGEVTSEKAVFGLYIDGKVNAVLGTHTHVQTNDAQILPKGTAYITDVGMTGPIHSAIGAEYEDVYQRMRYEKRVRFGVSKNRVKFNAVIVSMNKNSNEIQTINRLF